MSYNGWANYETWNVALWIGNDEGLYSMARDYKRQGYKAFAEGLKELAPAPIAFQTPDGVAWNDSGLDIEALDRVINGDDDEDEGDTPNDDDSADEED
jgi:hypothetical protein